VRTLIFEGRATRRALGPDDGMTVPLIFERGVPLEVAEANAAAILGDPDTFGPFREGDPTETGEPAGPDQAAAGETGAGDRDTGATPEEA